MIIFFNRKEVGVTRSQDQLNLYISILEKNCIEYRVITNSITNSGRHHGVPGINADFTYEYRIYVNKADYKKAMSVLKIKSMI